LSYVEKTTLPPTIPLTSLSKCLNLKRADYSSVQSLPEIWPLAQQRFGQTVALKDPHAQPEVVLTYAQLYQQIQQFAAGLQALGATS